MKIYGRHRCWWEVKGETSLPSRDFCNFDLRWCWPLFSDSDSASGSSSSSASGSGSASGSCQCVNVSMCQCLHMRWFPSSPPSLIYAALSSPWQHFPPPVITQIQMISILTTNRRSSSQLNDTWLLTFTLILIFYSQFFISLYKYTIHLNRKSYPIYYNTQTSLLYLQDLIYSNYYHWYYLTYP